MINTINKIYNLVLKYKGEALNDKECKLFQELEKEKSNKDELQELLNVVNDKIIDLSYSRKEHPELQIRLGDFHYFKGMIIGLMDGRRKNNGKEK